MYAISSFKVRWGKRYLCKKHSLDFNETWNDMYTLILTKIKRVRAKQIYFPCFFQKFSQTHVLAYSNFLAIPWDYCINSSIKDHLQVLSCSSSAERAPDQHVRRPGFKSQQGSVVYFPYMAKLQVEWELWSWLNHGTAHSVDNFCFNKNLCMK